MPPARKTLDPEQVAAEPAAKRPFPRHVINIQDLINAKDDKNKGHLVININQFSPEGITISRSGDKLTVESTKESKPQGGPAVEHVTRYYKIPEDGYTQELGAQLSTEGLISVGGPGMNKRSGRVIPINIAGLKQMKGALIKVDTSSGVQTVVPLNSPFTLVQPKGDKQPGANADKDMGVPEDDPGNTQDLHKDKAA